MTKANSVPPGWQETTLGKVLDIKNGRSRPQDGTKFAVYGGNGILGYVDDYNSEGPLIIVGRVGAYCGNVFLERNKFWLSDNALGIKANENSTIKYLYYLLKWLNLNTRAIGGAQPLLTQGIINQLEISLPESTTEQEAIASTLSSLDDKIELLRQQNKTFENMAQALFKEWFVNFNFPDEKGDPYKSSGGKLIGTDFGEIPNKWNFISIYNLAKFINGKTFRSNDFSHLGLPIIKIAELKNGVDKETKLTEHQHGKEYLLTNMDILFSWSGSPETSIDCFIWHSNEAWLNQHIFKVIPNKPLSNGFIYFLLKTFMPEFIAIAKNKQTTGLGHVTVSDLKRLRIALPDYKNNIWENSKLFDTLYKKIYLNLKNIQTIEHIRNNLLPKLMKGEITISK